MRYPIIDGGIRLVINNMTTLRSAVSSILAIMLGVSASVEI